MSDDANVMTEATPRHRIEFGPWSRVGSSSAISRLCLPYWRRRPLSLPGTTPSGTPSHRRGVLSSGGSFGQIHFGVGCDLLICCLPRSLRRIWVTRSVLGLPPGLRHEPAQATARHIGVAGLGGQSCGAGRRRRPPPGVPAAPTATGA